MGVKQKGYHELVTENSVLELSTKEFNMLMLHKLFETREYLLGNYDLSAFDGIDEAEIVLEIYKMREEFELYSGYSELTVIEVFEDAEFKTEVRNFIEDFNGF